jgi:hypothetical protein
LDFAWIAGNAAEGDIAKCEWDFKFSVSDDSSLLTNVLLKMEAAALALGARKYDFDRSMSKSSAIPAFGLVAKGCRPFPLARSLL